MSSSLGGKDSAMRLCIYEDRAELLEPLSLTRPVFDLRCGMTTLAQKQCRPVGAGGVRIRGAPHTEPPRSPEEESTPDACSTLIDDEHRRVEVNRVRRSG